MKRALILPLALLALSFGAASCVTEDWDYDDEYDYDTARWSRRHRYDDYDYAYERGRSDGERYERDRRDRYERDRRERRDHERDERDRDAPKPPKGYVLAGSFKSGNAVECGIPTGNKIKKVRLVGRSGKVSVNSVVLREGGAKTSFPVTRRLEPGENVEIDLGGARQATGLRISTGGKGAFDVYVR